jgi:CRISPR/Cas system-associated exonuclease Cas4 (RecB family)
MAPRMTPSDDYYRIQRLSWSGYTTYQRCPLAYKKAYVDEEEVPRPNAYNAVAGKTIQAVFERFYNDQIWRRGKETKAALLEILPKEYERILSEEIVDWKAPESKLSKEELLESIRPLIGSTLEMIKENRLIGKYAKSEVQLQAWIDKVLVHGIADFVIRRDNSHIILDGKHTRHRSKYLKVEQLTYYVMLFWLQHQVVVDKVGWIYYSYGELDYIPISLTDVKRLHESIRATIADIRRNKFEATPSTDACRFCDYAPKCEFGAGMSEKEKVERRKASAAKQQKKYEESGSPLANEITGVEEIGF